MITCMDFESHDPLLRKYGSGAVFKYHYPEIDFELLGVGVKTETNLEYIDFVNDNKAKDKFSAYMRQASTIIMHNAAYDLSCIKYLYRETINIEKFLPIIHDTMLIAKLVDQHKKSYSLDSLAKDYKCTNLKESNLLHDYAWSSGIYQEQHKLKVGRNCHKRPSYDTLEEFCKTNLHLFPANIVGDYCLGDINATWELYYKLMPLLGDYDLTNLNKIIKICLKTKFKGVRIDLPVTTKLSKQWRELANNSKDKFKQLINVPTDSNININSGEQIGPELEKIGIKIPRTLKGGYSITKDWLEEQGHPALEQLRLYRASNKAEKDFIQKILKYQEIIPEKYRKEGIGIMFPTLKPLGATKTGRFTSGGGKGSLELNVLAISGRDEHFGMPIRELFLPYHDDEKIVCADFSNQEPRLQVHYAKVLSCAGADLMVKKWNDDPHMKLAKVVAEIAELDYNTAKTLLLGMSYGMGVAKAALKLNISYQAAKTLFNKLYTRIPFLKQLQEVTKQALKKNGYIKTIGGRKLFIDPPGEFNGKISTKEHKGMSKLIQGSGLDQLWASMIAVEEVGLNFMLCVHDEMIISSKAINAEKERDMLVDCMQNSYILYVPVIAEAGIGDNWLQAKP